MATNQQIQNALDALNANPMFHMSLASKELFHSNFLYWLWKLDANKFLTLLDKLSGGEDSFCKMNPKTIEVKREYQHFDLCVLEKDKPLLVIENKVKSIPYVEQLNEYTGKLDGDCKKVLLTLMQYFPDKSNISGWEIKHYNDLAVAIKESYVDTEYQTFIDEYIKFISILHNLSTSWNPDNVLITKQTIYKVFENLRLHDLFGKLFFSRVAAELKKNLVEQGVDLSNISVSSSYSDQMPLFDVTIRNVIDTKTEFIIQVQGTSYRHAVARPDISYADLCNEMNTNDAVQKMWWPDGYFIQRKRDGNLGYNKFELKSVKGCFIYKYITLVNSSTGCNNEVDAGIYKLIEYIVNEVKAIYQWKQEMQKKEVNSPHL